EDAGPWQAAYTRHGPHDESGGRGGADAVRLVPRMVASIHEPEREVDVREEGRRGGEERAARDKEVLGASGGQDVDRQPREGVAYWGGHFEGSGMKSTNGARVLAAMKSAPGRSPR